MEHPHRLALFLQDMRGVIPFISAALTRRFMASTLAVLMMLMERVS